MTTESQTRWALIILATIAVLAVLWLAKAVFAPLTLAFTVAVVFAPLSDFWQRLGIPVIVGSLISLGLGLAICLLLVIALEPVAASLYQKAPLIKWELRQAVSGLQSMLRGLDQVSQEVSEAISPDAPANGKENSEPAMVAVPPLSRALLLAPAIIGQLMVFAGGLYFLLLCRQDVYRWLARFAKGTDAAAIEVFRAADLVVARYSLAITVINAAFGASVGIGLQLAGMPNPILWAVVAALFNFVMYLGPAIVAVSLFVAGAVVFDGLYSVVPALVFIALNIIEGQFVTPLLIGRHMRVNPLLVFLSLCLWLWLWGPVGGIIAIPVLVWLLAVAEGLRTQNSRGMAEDMASGAALLTGEGRPLTGAASAD